MLLFGRVWTLIPWVKKVVGCFRHCLMGHTSRNMKEKCSENDLNYGGLTQEVSEKKNFNMLPRDHSCDILVKKVAAFCPCLKSLPEAKVNIF